MRSFEVAQAGGRGRIRSGASNKFKFWCPCGTMGVNQSHVRELRLVSCMQCGTYGHRKCNGIENDEQASCFLCKSCMRYMSKQVEFQTGGVSMDVLGPFYPEGDNYVSWTSSQVGYFIHTIKRKDTHQKVATATVAAQEPKCTEVAAPASTPSEAAARTASRTSPRLEAAKANRAAAEGPVPEVQRNENDSNKENVDAGLHGTAGKPVQSSLLVDRASPSADSGATLSPTLGETVPLSDKVLIDCKGADVANAI